MISERINISENVKSKLFGFTKLLISLGIVAFLLFKFDVRDILLRLQNANLYYLFFAFLLLAPNIFIQFLKWKIILRNVIDENDNKKIWRSLMLGLAAGMITPWRSGEYVGRALPFDSKKTANILFSTFLDKGTTLFLVSFFGGISSLYFIGKVYHVDRVITIPLLIFLLLLSVLFYFMLFSSGLKKKDLAMAIIPSRFKSRFSEKLNFLDSVPTSSFSTITFLSAAQLIVVFTQFALLIYAFGGGGYLPEIYLASLLVFFSKSFFPPVTVADLGIREAAAVFFFGRFGIGEPTAFSAAIFLFLINLLIPSLYSLFLSLKK